MNFANQEKLKAVTFSYDDGVTQDVRLINLLNKYNLKCTFNINSELLSKGAIIVREGKRISHYKMTSADVKSVYEGHEIAVHTLTHPNLTSCDESEIIRQVENDRLNLSEIAGYEVFGMAYPGGGFQNSDRVEELIRRHTGVKYARTISLGYSFKPQDNLFRYKPTAFHLDFDDNLRLAEEFFAMEGDGIFYIWGHSYEFDINDTWDAFEEFCKKIANRPGVSYLTGKEALL